MPFACSCLKASLRAYVITAVSFCLPLRSCSQGEHLTQAKHIVLCHGCSCVLGIAF